MTSQRSTWMRPAASRSGPPSRPARSASASARIETAVSAGLSAPMSRPAGPAEAVELLLGHAGLEQPLAPLLLGAAAAERADVERIGAQSGRERRDVELVVVGQHDDRRVAIGANPREAPRSGHSTTISSALGTRSGVAYCGSRVDADRVPADRLRGGAERLAGVDGADDDESRRRPEDLGEDLRALRARAGRCGAAPARAAPARVGRRRSPRSRSSSTSTLRADARGRPRRR